MSDLTKYELKSKSFKNDFILLKPKSTYWHQLSTASQWLGHSCGRFIKTIVIISANMHGCLRNSRLSIEMSNWVQKQLLSRLYGGSHFSLYCRCTTAANTASVTMTSDIQLPNLFKTCRQTCKNCSDQCCTILQVGQLHFLQFVM